MEQIQHVLKWIDQGKAAAIATVIWKQGSALRGVGSKMAVNTEMEISGSVSGGCIEGAVIQEALGAMKSGEIKTLEYGITDEDAWSVGLACGGKIRLLIQPINPDDTQKLTKKLLLRLSDFELLDETFCEITKITGKYSGETGIIKNERFVFPDEKIKWVNKSLLKSINIFERKGTSGIINYGEDEVFADFYFPKPRIVIIGAVHIAIPLVEMAKLCGFISVVIDPRKVFANPERFPMANDLIVEWPEKGLEKIHLKQSDYLLLLSHDDKIDLPALQVALENKVNYIGMLSSAKTRNDRFQLLAKQGYSVKELKRIHAPVGLDIGPRTPEEIALSILAEITAFRYGKE
jgi:xanthine dehydrogenase accessory factor